MKVVFFLFLFKDDISYKKVATQLHTSIFPGNYASNAVDRNPETCMRTLPIGTNSPDKTVWWKVDLGGVYSIHSINILFKNYNGYGVLLILKSFDYVGLYKTTLNALLNI